MSEAENKASVYEVQLQLTDGDIAAVCEALRSYEDQQWDNVCDIGFSRSEREQSFDIIERLHAIKRVRRILETAEGL